MKSIKISYAVFPFEKPDEKLEEIFYYNPKYSDWVKIFPSDLENGDVWSEYGPQIKGK